MRNLTDLMEEVPLKEQWHRIVVGLHAPADSGEHRYAVYALMHMIGPSGLSVLGSTLIAMAALFITIGAPGNKTVLPDTPTIVIDLPERPVLDPVDEPEPSKEKDNFIPPIDPIVETPWTSGSGSSDRKAEPEALAPANSRPFGSEDGLRDNELKVTLESLAPFQAKSPLLFKNLRGRTGEDRDIALGKYGAPDGGGGDDGRKGYASEFAVRRALRWLKREQLPDGSWKNTKPAMTGLALLTYLAHGDTPATSREFGTTVEKGIKWLLDNQEEDGRFRGRDAHDYSHPIATYALCEAYGMTKLPFIKSAAEKAVDVIIRGQNVSGGWDYNCKPSERNDTSYMGWCAQALKAAKMAKLENEGLSQALKKSIMGFKKNSSPGGGFGYTGPGDGGLTGIGVLCMQLLGAAREPECRNGVIWLEKNCSFDWAKPWLASPIYYWYYVTQAKFHSGGDIWNKWNSQFAPQLVKNQKIEKKAVEGPGGKKVDIGWWEPPEGIKGHTDGTVMDTCLCTLQLEVYYRYLPTFEKVPQQQEEEPEINKDDLSIQVSSISLISR